MQQVSGPVIAVGLVLAAVFVPCTFITGIIGQFFKQFALTIAVSTVISAFNSLTLSPALSALLLKHRQKGAFENLPWLAFVAVGAALGFRFIGLAPWLTHLLEPWMEREAVAQPALAAVLPWVPWLLGLVAGAVAGGVIGLVAGWPLNRLMGWSFNLFNRAFDWSTSLYTKAVGKLLRVSVVVLAIYGGLLCLTWWSFTETPTGFIPSQDKGYLLVNVQLPDSAAVWRTEAVMRKIEEVAMKTGGVDHAVSISGTSILLNANAPNFGAMYLMLKPFEERLRPELSADALAATLEARMIDAVGDDVVEDGVKLFGAPPIEGLGTAGGFKVVIEDRGDEGLDELEKSARRVMANGAALQQGDGQPSLQGLSTSFRAGTPWLELDIDRTQAKTLGLSMSEIFNTLQVYLGSYYVNDFNRFGRTWQVNIQADEDFRRKIDDLRQLEIRNSQGRMVPFASVVRFNDKATGPLLIMRYNMYPAAGVHADAGPGVSSGQAIALLDQAAKKDLPPSMRTEWTELGLLQQQTGSTAMLVFVLAVVLVFLVLAAQYESWSLPLAVILVVPMCLLCSIAGVNLARLDVNIFTQIGFIVLVGLACKNAILIVEFAKARREEGVDRRQATLDAVQLRLRPIIMTSFAFILGVVPLAISAGAGAEMRRTLGTAVFAGMLGVTLFGIFLTPVFYYVIQWVSDLRGGPSPPPDDRNQHGHDDLAPPAPPPDGRGPNGDHIVVV
jgi:hydrophobe/amphiphile efflux-1 (HAE1) family protein